MFLLLQTSTTLRKGENVTERKTRQAHSVCILNHMRVILMFITELFPDSPDSLHEESRKRRRLNDDSFADRWHNRGDDALQEGERNISYLNLRYCSFGVTFHPCQLVKKNRVLASFISSQGNPYPHVLCVKKGLRMTSVGSKIFVL